MIRCILCIKNYFKPNIIRKFINTDLYCLIYISLERIKRGDYIHAFHQNQKLVLLEKLSELDWVFVELVRLSKIFEGSYIIFLLFFI